MKIVIAIGGNALLQRNQKQDISTQRVNVKLTCQSIAKLAQDHQVILTHGNGPQIGLLALQETYPLDILSAESQGMIGYLLAQELRNQLPEHSISVVLTQVEVLTDDPAFLNPTKFIGPLYTKDQMQRLRQQYPWEFHLDGDKFRRVVPSPLPHKILEIDTLKSLSNSGFLVICAGGGGIPVVQKEGQYQGIAAVIDKDFTSSLLAEALNADRLMILTDVSNVMLEWDTPTAKAIKKIKASELEQLTFTTGSMAPKVLAACQFVKHTQKIAHIGLLSEAEAMLNEMAGTVISVT
jgi:carbamate kinase